MKKDIPISEEPEEQGPGRNRASGPFSRKSRSQARGENALRENAAVPPGEETVERPIAELLPPKAPPPTVRAGAWLSKWLLLTGTVSLLTAIGSIALALLVGAGRADWKGPLLAFDGAVIIFIVRTSLVAGAAAPRVCHRLFSAAGMTAAALFLLGTLLRSAVGFIYGKPRIDLLTELSLLGFLGATACLLFFHCFQGRGWACRTAAVSSVVFLILLLLQPVTGYGFFMGPPLSPLSFLKFYWPGFTATAFAAGGFLLTLARAQNAPKRQRGLWTLASCWLASLVGITIGVAALLAGHYGASGASSRLWMASVVWAMAGLTPALLSGLVSAWRRRGGLQADMVDMAGFACSVVALAGLACLVLWVPPHFRVGKLELFLVVTGILAAIMGVWLTETRGDWASRWTLIPTAALAVALLSGLGSLLDYAEKVSAPREDLWRFAAAFLWCPLVIGATFAAIGMVAKRSRSRSSHPQAALQADVRLVCTAGSTMSGLLLCILFAFAAGNPTVVGNLHQLLAGARGLLKDWLVLGLGPPAVRWLLHASAPVGALLAGRAGQQVAAGALLAAFTAHVAAASRAGRAFPDRGRWSLAAVSGLWLAFLSAGTLFALLYASRLLMPVREPGLTTAIGGFVGSHFAARLFAFVILVGLLARFWEALRSVIRAGQPGRPGPAQASQDRLAPPTPEAQAGFLGGRRLGLLICLGVVLSAMGLALAVLLHLSAPWEAALFELSRLAEQCMAAGLSFGVRVGQLSAQWVGFAAAAALTAFLLICVHEEGRRGRAEVYLLMGTAWTLFLLAPVRAWVEALRATPHPSPPGRTVALAVTGTLLAALVIPALALLASCFRSQGTKREEGERHALVPWPGGSAWAAHTLGSLGLALCLAACVAVLHGALASEPAYERLHQRAADQTGALVSKAAAGVEALRTALERRGDLQSGAALLAGASGILLLLHFLARYRVAWARGAVYALWLLAALAGLGLIGYMVHRDPLGTWTGEQVFGAVLVAAAIVCILGALFSSGSWLTGRAE